MTDIEAFLARLDNDEVPSVDWSCHPWVAARPALHWLDVGPGVGATPNQHLSSIEAKPICDRMIRRFTDDSGKLAWSSHMVETALDVVAASIGGPPEPLLQSAWEYLGSFPLDELCYEFCRAVGRQVLAVYREQPGWDLAWMLEAPKPSQACLRYWTLGVKPQLWDAQVEQETMDILKEYPFQF